MPFPPRRAATTLVWQCRLSQDILSGQFHSDWVTQWQAKTLTSAAVPFRSPTGIGSLAGDPISASILSVAMSMQGSTSTGVGPVTSVAARNVCEKSTFASDRAGPAAECSPRIESWGYSDLLLLMPPPGLRVGQSLISRTAGASIPSSITAASTCPGSREEETIEKTRRSTAARQAVGA